jgi:Peroxiredoxin
VLNGFMCYTFPCMPNFMQQKNNMRRLFFLLIGFVFSFLAHAQEKPEGLFINSKAPDFKATDQYGNEIRLKDVLKDSLVVLIFYRGQWCPIVTSN